MEESVVAISLSRFQRELISSGVLDADQLRSFLAELPAASRPSDSAELARLLVKKKSLTAYQAQQIYRGKGNSLTLGNYTILDKLGEGGMGMVFKAEHRRMERVVALKVLSPSVTRNTDAIQRFLREVKAAAKLEHPNIVTAYDADEDKKTHFLVMQFVDGMDLAALVRQQGVLAPDKAIAAVLQAARGLEYAHSRGVVHRDIKPANLLMDREGTVRILDMGLARLESTTESGSGLTGTGQVMGTVDYMAPEQAVETRAADARADIYSLGVTLWFLLTGRPLYEGETLVKRLMAHQNHPIPSLRDGCPRAPVKLEAIFQRMVAKSPDARQQSVAEVVRELESLFEKDASPASLPSGVAEDEHLNQFLQGLGQETQARPLATRVANKKSLAAAQAPPQAAPTVTLAQASLDTARQTADFTQADPATPEPRPAQVPVPRGGRRFPRSVGIAAAAAAGGLVLLASIVLFLRLGKVDVQITLDDPTLQLSVDGDALRITGAGNPIRLSAGNHQLRVERDGLELLTDEFVVKRGELNRIHVAVVQGEVRVVQGAERPDEAGARRVRSETADNRTAGKPASNQAADNASSQPQSRAPGEATGDRIAARDRLPQSGSGQPPRSPTQGKTVWDFDQVAIQGLGIPLRSSLRTGPGRFCLYFPEVAQSRVEMHTLKHGQLVDQSLTIEGWVKRDPGAADSQQIPFGFGAELCLFTGDSEQAPLSVQGGIADQQRLAGAWRGDQEYQWTHAAIVRDVSANKMRLYLNGQKQREMSLDPSQIPSPEQAFQLAPRFRGWLAEVRVSSVPRYDADFEPRCGLEVDGHTIALFRFEEGEGASLVDVSGNAHHGKIVNATWQGSGQGPASPILDWSTPKVDYALQFNRGRTFPDLDGVVVPTLTAPRTLTLEFWLQRDPQHLRPHSWIAGFSSDSYYLGTDSGGDALGLRHRDRFLAAQDPADQARLNRELVHLAWVVDHDEQQIRFFQAGKLVDSSTWNPVPPPPGNFQICGAERQWHAEWSKSEAFYFEGLIDEVRISRVARYREDFVPQRRFDTDPDTLALFHCDEGRGNVLLDASGNRNHGRIVGTHWVKVGELPPQSSERQVALWARDVAAHIYTNGEEILPDQPLPGREFPLLGLRFDTPVLLGDREFRLLATLPKLDALELIETRFSGQGLRNLETLDTLTSVTLVNLSASSEDMRALSQLKSLHSLVLVNVLIGDDGARHLSNLTGLEYLELLGAGVTDATAPALASLTKTRNLVLDQNPITDKFLDVLVNMPHLNSLRLAGTHLTDKGMETLAKISTLKYLMLVNTQVSDRGLRPLAGLPHLTELNIAGTRVSDAGLEVLKGASSLKHVQVGVGQFSDSALEAFRKSRPDCAVVLDPQ